MLGQIFSDEAQLDLRQPVATVAVPNWMTSFLLPPHQKVECDVLLPDINFWIQWGVVWLIQSINVAVLSYLAYILVLGKERSTSTYLLGYGVIIPLVLITPFYIATWFNIASPMLKLTIAVHSALCAFRCIGAMHGTIPHDLGANATTFCIYCTSVVDNVRDEKGKMSKTTKLDNKKNWKRFVKSFIMVGVMLTVLDTPQDWKLFNYTPSSFFQFLHLKHLINNFAIAYLQHLTLLSGTSVAALIAGHLTGTKLHDASNDPLLSSSSPSDFWGRRWNNIVHRAMKVRMYISGISKCSIVKALQIISPFIN